MNDTNSDALLHAYLDGELAPPDASEFERMLAADPKTAARVAAWRAQKAALHARYDALLDETHGLGLESARAHISPGSHAQRSFRRSTVARAAVATLVIGLGSGAAAGWFGRAAMERRDTASPLANARPSSGNIGGQIGEFVRVAAIAHVAFAPEVRHPVEVGADQEAHLVAWLGKRLGAPLVVPHLAEAGWHLLGGRLLPAQAGPLAQFMYEDAGKRRLTLAVSHAASVASGPEAGGVPAFRITEEDGVTVFYWIDAGYAYALSAAIARTEMLALAERAYRQLDRQLNH